MNHQPEHFFAQYTLRSGNRWGSQQHLAQPNWCSLVCDPCKNTSLDSYGLVYVLYVVLFNAKHPLLLHMTSIK